jgi:hypothetical protein
VWLSNRAFTFDVWLVRRVLRPTLLVQGGGNDGDQLGGEGKDDMMMMYGNADVMQITKDRVYIVRLRWCSNS